MSQNTTVKLPQCNNLEDLFNLQLTKPNIKEKEQAVSEVHAVVF
jgi:hypothetical protein